MQLANETQSTGPILSTEASPYFIILFRIQFEFCSITVNALLDSGALACFIDKDFAEYHKLFLVTKKIPIHVEVIDGRFVISGDVVQETKPLSISLENHQSSIVFNVIKSPSSSIILDLSWLDRYNPDINLNTSKLTFQSSNLSPSYRLETPKQAISMHHRTRVSKTPVPLMVSARTFMRAAKKRTMFAMYAILVAESIYRTNSLLVQYEEY